MPKQSVSLYALNRGEVSKLALARVDIERLRLSAEEQVNWMPRTMGPMMLRPGTAFVGEVNGSQRCKLLPFIYAHNDTAMIELTANAMRIWVDDALVARPSVSTAISGDFSTWTIVGTGNAKASGTTQLRMYDAAPGGTVTATKQVTVAGGNVGKEHALRIVIDRGPVKFRVGSTSGAEDFIKTTTLDDGTHSLAFTPTGDAYLQFENSSYASRYVGSIAIEASGVMSLPTSWDADDLTSVRIDQSADVVFVACAGQQQRRIERRGRHSWSVVLFKTDDGPFGLDGDGSIFLTPSVLTGDGTLSASKPAFEPGHVGSLFRLFHNNQVIQQVLAVDDTYTKPIRVSGVSITQTSGGGVVSVSDRNFTVTITGTWAGTLQLQRSFDGPDSGFVDYAAGSWTGNVAASSVYDGLDNIVCWYRIGFKPGEYTSGVATVNLSYHGGGAAGICRVTGYTDSQTVDMSVISAFYGTNKAASWKQSRWSDAEGWPTAVGLHEGRLWLGGNDRVQGSVSDAYSSFDYDKAGDAGPIDRSIGYGPIANIAWLLSLNRLILGADTSIIPARSNSFDEPLNPTNFNLKTAATLGAANIPAGKIDTRGIFIDQAGRRVYELAFDVQISDYKGGDLTRLNDEIGVPGLLHFATQRQPDTRLHFVRGDGQAAILVYDLDDSVMAWWRFKTDGLVEDIVVLPGMLEDRVYYVVNRTIGDVTKRYIERHARIDECQGGTLNKHADCHAIYQGAPLTTLTGLGFLEGKNVVVWADGKEVGFDPDDPDTIHTYTVVGGSVTLPVAVSDAVVGLPYTADFTSAKLAYAAAQGTAINQVKRVDHIGFILSNTHYQGVRYGASKDGPLDSLPLVENGAETAADTIWDTYDQQMIEFPGVHDTDSRIYLQGRAPRPATVMGVAIEIQTQG